MNCEDTNSTRRRAGGGGEGHSRIPVPSSPSTLRRSGSQRLPGGWCPPIKEHSSGSAVKKATLSRHRSLQSLTTAAPLSSRLSSDHDDDLDSLHSYGSGVSAYSTASQCDHAHFARNGTTFSARRMRYVVHCSPHSSAGDDYLTPTQRANRTIRRLKALLAEAQAELVDKDREIFRLTKEVVELRLLKMDSGTDGVDSVQTDTPNRLSASHDDILTTDIASNQSEQRAASSNGGGLSPPLVVDLPPSLADSGHFEDLTNGKDWSHSPHTSPRPRTSSNSDVELLRRHYEDIIRDLKEKHNDKVDSLLQRITKANDRYYELRPQFDACQERIRELEKENLELKQCRYENYETKIEELEKIIDDLKIKKETESVGDKMVDSDNSVLKKNYENRIRELEKENEELRNNQKDQEEKQKLMYLQMYKKGQDAVRFEQAEIVQPPQLQLTEKVKNEEKSGTVKQLLQQLEVTQKELENVKDNEFTSSGNLLSAKEAVSLWILGTRKAMYRRIIESKQPRTEQDPAMTLQFLKSAIYYFLTDRENCQGHLSAIESILGFTDNEKLNIDKAYLWR